MNKIQEKLYSYKNYFEDITHMFQNQKLPSSILIKGNKGTGINLFVKHLIANINQKKYFFFRSELNLVDYLQTDLNILKELYENKNPNVRFVYKNPENLNITIDQIRDLMSFVNKSSFNSSSKFVVICNAEELNLNAANSLLKLLENPPINTFFFLTTNSEHSVIDTIRSRCLKYDIKFSCFENKNILNNLLNDHKLSLDINLKNFTKFQSAGSIISKSKFIISNNITHYSILEILIFCLTEYKKNKKTIFINNALEFSEIFFYNKICINFNKINKIYNNFLKKILYSLRYNTDITPAIIILKKYF